MFRYAFQVIQESVSKDQNRLENDKVKIRSAMKKKMSRLEEMQPSSLPKGVVDLLLKEKNL